MFLKSFLGEKSSFKEGANSSKTQRARVDLWIPRSYMNKSEKLDRNFVKKKLAHLPEQTAFLYELSQERNPFSKNEQNCSD